MTAGTEAPAGDQARVSVVVRVPPDFAFRMFTEQIDQWWRRGLQYRVAGNNRGFIHLEPHVGGRLFESFEVGNETKIFETGKVTAWEPSSRLAFEWRAANFAPTENTLVEVTFEACASGTLVVVTHRGWSEVRSDHPARHGQSVPVFLRMMGMWWGDLMIALRQYAAHKMGAGGGPDPS